MKYLILLAAFSGQQTTDVIIDYPNHTWVGYNCTVTQSKYICPTPPQSFISDVGDVYFVNDSVLHCVKTDSASLVHFDCTNNINP